MTAAASCGFFSRFTLVSTIIRFCVVVPFASSWKAGPVAWGIGAFWGLVVVEGDRHLELTPAGREAATRVMRKHRLAECLLVEVLGMPWEEVHAEACRWEHVMSEDVERRLVKVLDNPTISPFGNPIPGMALLGLDEAGGVSSAPALVRLTELPPGTAAVVVRQLTEHVQGDVALISRLKEAGVVPNARVQVETSPHGDVTIVVGGHQNVELPHEMAHAVNVERVVEKV